MCDQSRLSLAHQTSLLLNQHTNGSPWGRSDFLLRQSNRRVASADSWWFDQRGNARKVDAESAQVWLMAPGNV